MNLLKRSHDSMGVRVRLWVAALLLAWQVFFCESTHAEPIGQPLRVGFVMDGPVSDWSWNYAHEQGRLYAESKLSGKVATTVAENVPESSEAERVIEKMIAQGCKLIFTTSYGSTEKPEE